MSRWHSVNVLQVNPALSQLWRFNAEGDRFAFSAEQSLLPSESCPTVVAKDWTTLFRRKFNVAWLPADKDIETFTTQGNTFAVACGLVPKERSRQVMEKIIYRTDLHCQPYFMHFVFQALSTAGLFNKQAVAQLSKWHIVPDTQSFLEMWNTGDLSHAWIGTPIYQMSGQILGVNPTSPGFATFAITPHPCDLKWARGVVPTPHGLIGVWWKKVRGGYELQFVVPEGTIANVEGKSYGPGRHRTRFDPGFNSRS